MAVEIYVDYIHTMVNDLMAIHAKFHQLSMKSEFCADIIWHYLFWSLVGHFWYYFLALSVGLSLSKWLLNELHWKSESASWDMS